MNAALRLQVRDHREQVFSLRIAFLTEHAHKAFRWGICGLAEIFKADCRVDIAAQNGLPDIHIAR